MQTTYRFCKVDPGTWLDNEVIDNVESADITYDLTLDTKGMMTLTTIEDVGEAYIRAYILRDNNQPEVIGTFLAQTQSSSHDGRLKRYTIEAYSPLHELNETYPAIGYTIAKGATIAERAAYLAEANCRAPVVGDLSGTKTTATFTAEVDETWLAYLSELLAMDGKSFIPDYGGSILIVPDRDASSMQPVFEFVDSNASITKSDIEEQRDLYQVPNKVVVIAPNGMQATATNTNNDTPLSYSNRGRWIEKRVTDPSLPEGYTQTQLNDYAKKILSEESLVEHTVQFVHLWVPNLRIGDCVRLDFERSDIHTRAIIQSMKLTCDKSAMVETTVTYTEAMI